MQTAQQPFDQEASQIELDKLSLHIKQDLKASDITQLRSMGSPPEGVKILTEVLMIIDNQK
jgi:hypothetical protein